MIVDVQTVAGTKREHNARSSGLQSAVRFRTQTSRRAMGEGTPGSPDGEERRWLLKLCAVGGRRRRKECNCLLGLVKAAAEYGRFRCLRG